MAEQNTDLRALRLQMLNRVLSSRQFAHAHVLKRILRYLAERSCSGAPPPKEYEIAVEVMGRPPCFDPRLDPIVRVSIANIRERLLAYYMTEGKDDPLRILVPKGQYVLQFTEFAHTERHRQTPSAVARFWAPYFSGKSANIIVYTEPLFFCDDSGKYFRDWYVNEVAALEDIQKRLASAGFGSVRPAYHYLSTGEMQCLLSITRMFHELGVPVETRNSRTVSWGDLRGTNLILLGSPRTNPFLSSLQGSGPFLVLTDRVENREPRAGEQPTYRGCRHLDGTLMRRTEFAVVTRRPGLGEGTIATLIAANHGKAIQGSGHFLTLEDKVDGLFTVMGFREDREAPQHFQCLMRIEMIDLDDEVIEVRCTAHRIVGP